VEADRPAVRVTAEELVTIATANGLRATRRLITDWVSLGLLDRPYHPGQGRRNGSKPGTWPLTQAELFVDLLSLRQRPENPVTHVAALANVPVSGWLWMGDAGGVPLRQVRLALKTWCGHHRSRKGVSTVRARKIAREMLRQFDNPHATRPDRGALLDLLATSIANQTFDAEQTQSALERVFDPHQVGRALGPEEVAATAASFARMLEAQAAGYLNLQSSTKQEVEDARVIYLQGRREYAQLQPRLASDRQGSPLKFDDATVENVLNTACSNLLFTLGLGRLSPRRHIQFAAEARQTEQNRETSLIKT
jgi:hypothetical protein